MDTGKLLKIIKDIQSDENDFKLQTEFQNILNFYNQNKPDELNTEKDILRENIENCRLSNYVLTDFKILDNLKYEIFFGSRSWVELNNILNSQAHEVSKKLTDFVAQRQEAITKLEAIKNSLNSVSLKERELIDSNYEIGFSFPEEYQKLSNFEEVIKDIKQFLVAIAEGKNENKEFRINYVSNGSIELFIAATQNLAHYFGVALEHALKVYEVIQLAEVAKKSYQFFATKRGDILNQLADEEKKEKSKNIIQDLVIELKITNPEDQTKITILFVKLLKHFENGVSAEVKTPLIDKPLDEESTEDIDTKSELRELKIRYESNKEINERNKKIFKLQQENFNGLTAGFLTEGTNEDLAE